MPLICFFRELPKPNYKYLRTTQEYIVCANFDLLGQSSGYQVRSKSDVHSGTSFKIEDRAVGTVLVRMFSNFQDEILGWMPTKCMFRVFNISDLRSDQFSTRPIISIWENCSSVHNC